MKKICFLLFTISLCYNCAEAQEFTSSYRFGFYNVENLFDTKDDPERKDESFTPSGKNKWTKVRYKRKLNQLAQVIEGLAFPTVMGLAEVENGTVVEDLAAVVNDKEKVDYAFAHFESPDVRGIDVALLYDQYTWELDNLDSMRVTFPEWLEPEGYTSRDILIVTLRDKNDEVITFFINHWPSRRGGAEQSAPRRLWVASHLKRAVDEKLGEDPLSKMVIMGDFNDEPSDVSVQQVLGAVSVTPDSMALPGVLYNHFLSLQAANQGSYNYRGDWNMLDQIITSGFTRPGNWRVTKAQIYKEDWLLYESGSDVRPNRTYGGPNYYGGYSDHLPVFIDVKGQ